MAICEKINASRVAARPSEAGDKIELDRVFADAEDDRDRRGRSFGRERECGAGRGDHCHLSADQIAQQYCQVIVLTLQPVVLDRHVLMDLAMIVRGSLRCGIATRLMSAWGQKVNCRPAA